MTKARDFADIAGAVSGGKIASSDVNVSFENISDTGNTGTKVAVGTTGQRGSTAGQIRFNSTLGIAEYYDGSAFKAIATPPTISGVSPGNLESSALPANLTITGTAFSSGATVAFVGANGASISSGSVTVNSATQITAQVPNTITSANEPYTVSVSLTSGLSASLATAFNIDAAPVFGVAAGSLGTLEHANRAASGLTAVTATDDESDSVTFSVTAGSIPGGLTFATNGTWSGTATGVSSNTTSTFTVTASDGTNTSTRQYTILVNAPTVQAFTSTGSTTWTVPSGVTSASVLVVAGGGSGGQVTHSSGNKRGAGGGAGGLIYIASYPLTPGATMTAIVGAGGGGGNTNGTNTTFSDGSRTLTANGGGHGGYGDFTNNGSAGGSGGGKWYRYYGGNAGNQPTNTSDGSVTYNGTGFGNDGGGSHASFHDEPYGGGGGGAGSAGMNNKTANEGGSLADSAGNSITGSSSFAVGGTGKYLGGTFTDAYGESGWFASGGTCANLGVNATQAHLGGGGEGDNSDTTFGNNNANGQANTGGGGGSGGSGGSGVVLVAY